MGQVNLTPLVQQQSTSRLKFVEKYWFSNLQMITIRNPLDDDVVFMHEMRTYGIKAKTENRFPGSIANLYLDQMARILAQKDNDLGAIADAAKCGAYYDELIVHVEESAPEYSQEFGFATVPKNVSTIEPKQPFQSNEFIPPVNDAPIIREPQLPPSQVPQMKPGETREFTLGEDSFASMVMEDGSKAYLKNGNPIEQPEYARAVSML